MGVMKLDKQTWTILGGDARSLALGKMLSEDGKEVTFFGFNKLAPIEAMKKVNTLDQAIAASQIIVAPLPFSNKAGKLNTPNNTEDISIEAILSHIKDNQILLGGHIHRKWLELAADENVNVIDYFEREELQVLNAIPTAEGAIQLAMEEMDTTIHGSNVFVLGFGRIGKTVANTLAAMGANVYVVARKHADIAWILAKTYQAVFLQGMSSEIHRANLIINTIPHIVLEGPQLEKVNEDCLIIDLASQPGGVDLAAAENLGIRTVSALGLPGKVAPVSAARCIRETIYNILYDLEVD